MKDKEMSADDCYSDKPSCSTSNLIQSAETNTTSNNSNLEASPKEMIEVSAISKAPQTVFEYYKVEDRIDSNVEIQPTQEIFCQNLFKCENESSIRKEDEERSQMTETLQKVVNIYSKENDMKETETYKIEVGQCTNEATSAKMKINSITSSASPDSAVVIRRTSSTDSICRARRLSSPFSAVADFTAKITQELVSQNLSTNTNDYSKSNQDEERSQRTESMQGDEGRITKMNDVQKIKIDMSEEEQRMHGKMSVDKGKNSNASLSSLKSVAAIQPTSSVDSLDRIHQKHSLSFEVGDRLDPHVETYCTQEMVCQNLLTRVNDNIKRKVDEEKFQVSETRKDENIDTTLNKILEVESDMIEEAHCSNRKASVDMRKNRVTSLASSKSAAVINPTSQTDFICRSHRTRSISSTVSSITGEGEGRDGDNYLYNDGKTPVIENRRSDLRSSFSSDRSQGPVRKRHKARTLFNEPTVLNSDEVPIVPETYMSDGSDDTVLTSKRSRSNTIDSFRLAMSSQVASELQREDITLPEIESSVMNQHYNLDRSSSDTTGVSNYTLLDRKMQPDINKLTASTGERLDCEKSKNQLESLQSETADYTVTLHMKNTASQRSEKLRGEDSLPSRYSVSNDKKVVIFDKTPKKNNCSQDLISAQGPLKKRYRTRSLSYASRDQDCVKELKEEAILNENIYRNDAETVSSMGNRQRSNSAESLNKSISRRGRSDTVDFFTAAVAGDMGHDLDAAIEAATGDGASFAMHPVSAPSGASIHSLQPLNTSCRHRSDTIDSTASSINSSKLDFLVAVAADEGMLVSPIQEILRDQTDYELVGRPRSNTLDIYSSMAISRQNIDAVDFLVGDRIEEIDDIVTLPDDNNASGCVLDHLKALCDDSNINNVKTSGILRRKLTDSHSITSPRTKFEDENTKRLRTNSENTSKSNPSTSIDASSQRMLSESLQQFDFDRRTRFDSWGGMSDLSVTGMDPSTIAATHKALKSTGIIDDLMAAAADLGDDVSDELESNTVELCQENRTDGGCNNSQNSRRRHRFDSLASLSLASLSDASISISGRKEQYASELIQKQPTTTSNTSTSNPGPQPIVVDYDAIASAVHAANAATEGLDLESILCSKIPSASKLQVLLPSTDSLNAPLAPGSLVKKSTTNDGAQKNPSITYSATKLVFPQLSMRTTPMHPPTTVKTLSSQSQVSKEAPHTSSSQISSITTAGPPKYLDGVMNAMDQSKIVSFPLAIGDIPIPKCTKSEEELEAIRERARAAAGYVAPPAGSMFSKPASRKLPFQQTAPSSYQNNPLKFSNSDSKVALIPGKIMTSTGCISSNISESNAVLSQQKWDSMFDLLVKFIEETRSEETKDMNNEDKSAWVWDGNVPTNYKTKCGKALGRWINNQRSAKTKGRLRDDREVRLVSTGLKWSVITTNSWNEMLHELELYILQQKRDGRSWDGNVPTNYKIIVKSNRMDEEKNLGRWVNRQRSLYQAGKLKKERQTDLEKLGLKWSVMLTSSWTSMFEILCVYIDERRNESKDGIWDGNVPANYRTDSKPPVNLGRWINRQRCAHARGRLKDEFVKKLESVGLKWCMHEVKRNDQEDGETEDFVGEEFIPGDESSENKVIPRSVPSNCPLYSTESDKSQHDKNSSASDDVSSSACFSNPTSIVAKI